jgi:Xaa-Pro dipeptidase
MRSVQSCYASHLAEIRRRYDGALDAGGFGAVLIGAGVAHPVHRDDQQYPYRAEPLFLQWAPLTDHPGSSLLYQPGRKPVLLVLRADDFWHQPVPVPAGPWTRCLDVRIIREPGDIARHLPRRGGPMALLGDPHQWRPPVTGQRNPTPLLRWLDHSRALKTDYEIACIRQATRLALAGHRAVRSGFRAGLSEFELGIEFLSASGQTDRELPYPAIVAMNQNAATLHYQHRDRNRPTPSRKYSLLLDAGCGYAGYASDITRTHAARRGIFADMIADMERCQRDLCAQVRPGLDFADLQRHAHELIGGLLRNWGLVDMDPADMVEEQVTNAFFPHGLGHLLGLQVHDVGGNLASARGRKVRPSSRYPRLRLTRVLETGMVVTIEPGLYFIDSLLDKLRRGPHRRRCRWQEISRLRRYGGIRIEDDILVTDSGSTNLTRSLSGGD